MIERSGTVRDDLRPTIKTLILSARREAMAGQLPSALDHLYSVYPECEEKECAVVGMLLTELLYLTDKTEDAAQEFDRLVLPNLEALTEDVRYAYKLNRELVQLDPLKGGDPSNYNRLVKESAAAGIAWVDYRRLVRAWDDVTNQRLYAALEKLQEVMFAAYRVGYWTAIKVSESRYGRVALQAEDVQGAAESAILAEDERLAKQVAELLVRHRDVDQIRAIVGTVQGTANLKRHFVIGCTILHGLSDAIPDDLVGGLAAWLLPWASAEEEAYRGTGGSVNAGWQVLEPLGHRLSPAQALTVAEGLVAHPLWKGYERSKGLVLPVREQMIKTAGHLVWALPTETLGWFAQEAIPLALERKWDSDYPEVINLLCQIAERGSPATKEEIGRKLFAGDQRDYLQGQIAELFGQQFLTQERLEALVPKVRDNHQLSVQRLAPGQEPQRPNGSLMQFTKPQPEGGLVVRSVMNMVDWAALVRQRKHLSEQSRELLTRVGMSLIVDPENFLTNRKSLLMQLSDMADVLSLSLVEEIVDTLDPLARGSIEFAPDIAPTMEAGQGSKFFKAQFGRPEELQAAALIAMARFARRNPEMFRDRFESILQPALIHPDVAIRRGAFAAFRDFPGRLTNPFLAVLMGTRDPDPQAAITAFAALTEKQDLEISEYEWNLLLYSIRGAIQSPNVRLRRHAAGMLARHIAQVPNQVRKQAEELLGVFKADLCASVREEATFVWLSKEP